ncbi:MAG: hypothetical protein DRJ97_07015 [Thermoprotei archaeon]|nr:MAG: hypothetical protein DRJ97_07015 [Thermoprotei archaeon]
MSITPELYEFIVKVVEDRVRDVKVTRESFEGLTATVNKLAEQIKELAEAQRRTEEGLSKLAEAQLKTEERLNELAKRVDELAIAQRGTEEGLNTLAKRVDALAEAQLKTEERLNQLAEAQVRTERRLDELAKRVNALAEAQKRTEERLNQLAESVDKLTKGLNALRVEVGRLSDVVGFGLEDVARVMLPGWLHRRLGVHVEELRREFLKLNGEEVEVNLYGEGLKEGVKVTVVGEVKSRIYGDDVSRFHEKVFSRVRRVVEGEVLGVLFGYLIHPSAKRRAEELGLYVVASYER